MIQQRSDICCSLKPVLLRYLTLLAELVDILLKIEITILRFHPVLKIISIQSNLC